MSLMVKPLPFLFVVHVEGPGVLWPGVLWPEGALALL